MRTSDVSTLLEYTIAARLPVLLTGPPGCGKTSLVEQAAAKIGCDMIVSHPVVSDPTDAKGLPWPDPTKDRATFLPFGELAQAIECEKPTVWMLDDLGQAPAAVQASFMQLLLARRINGHALPDHVTFVAATNRRQDRAGVQGILEPVKSRFAAIVEVEPTVDDWSQWAFDAGHIPPEMVAFLRHRPDILSKFEATADISNTPSPRTWSNCAKMQALGMPSHLRFEAFAGAIGQGAATEYLAYLEMYKSLVSVDQILIDPHTAPIPKKPGELYAIATGLGYRANTTVFPRIAEYADRLNQAGHGEFATLTVRDCIRREMAIKTTPAFTKLVTSELGKLIMGEAI